MGVISAIGNSVAENHLSLKTATCGVRKEFDLFPTVCSFITFWPGTGKHRKSS
jgi:hypothetical protein